MSYSFLMHPLNPPPRELAFPPPVFLRMSIGHLTRQNRRMAYPAARASTRPLG